MAGYVSNSLTGSLRGGENAAVNLALANEGTGSGNYRIVLTWDPEASVDLNAYLWVPDGTGCTEVSWWDDGSDVAMPYATLTGTTYGTGGEPETIEIFVEQTGVYQFWVDNYGSSAPDITTSGGIVNVYRGDSLLKTYTVPISPTGMTAWHVFDLDAENGIISDIDTLDSNIDNGTCSNEGSSCSYSIDPSTDSFGAGGSGNGTVSYSVSENSSMDSRNGVITIAGNDHTVTQSGCTGTTYYQDFDGDGYGDSGTSVTACSQPEGYVSDNTDCNDDDANIHPGATETCNGLDDNCNESTDEGLPTDTYYLDYDEDGYGDPEVSTDSCSAPAGYVLNSQDYDDSDPGINPSADEICGNEIDDNCNGEIDEAECARKIKSLPWLNLLLSE